MYERVLCKLPALLLDSNQIPVCDVAKDGLAVTLHIQEDFDAEVEEDETGTICLKFVPPSSGVMRVSVVCKGVPLTTVPEKVFVHALALDQPAEGPPAEKFKEGNSNKQPRYHAVSI